MSNKNLLFVCEGEDDETLLKSVLSVYDVDINFEIYKYKTNLHLFANHLFKNYAFGNSEIIIEELDILQILKEFRYEAVLDKKFTDILFVFDYDPQDPRFNPNVLEKLIKIFSESTSQGQLYINYPMVESAIDFTSLPDSSYYNKVCKFEDLRFKGYKNSVKKNSIIKRFDQFNAVNLPVVLKQTYEKMSILTNGRNRDYVHLLKRQNDMFVKTKTISILCSCLLFVRDYNTNRFLSYIEKAKMKDNMV